MNLFLLALATFAIGTEGFMIAGLLPAIAADFEITTSTGGLLLTAFALTYAVGSPLLATAFNNVDRKTVLVLSLLVFGGGNLGAALAPGFGALMAARMLMALAAALCVSAANAVAVGIAPPERRGRAIAMVTSGLTAATALGVPLGALLGNQIHWRATFVAIAIITAIALTGLLLGLPRGLPRTVATLSQRLSVARQGPVLGGLLITLLWAGAGFSIFPFIAVLLGGAGLDAYWISVALFLFGVAAAVGNLAGGQLVDRIGPQRTLITALTLVMTVFLAIALCTRLLPPAALWIALLLLMVPWGIGGWAFHPAQASRLVTLAPQAPMVVLSLNASAMYLGIAIGSLAGGQALALGAAGDLGLVAAMFAATALGLTLLFARSRNRLATPIAG